MGHPVNTKPKPNFVYQQRHARQSNFLAALSLPLVATSALAEIHIFHQQRRQLSTTFQLVFRQFKVGMQLNSQLFKKQWQAKNSNLASKLPTYLKKIPIYFLSQKIFKNPNFWGKSHFLEALMCVKIYKIACFTRYF